MVQILDVYERTLGLLASQFRDTKLDGGLTNLQKVIKIISNQAQNIQDVEWELKTERWLSSAIGAQLDEIGIRLRIKHHLSIMCLRKTFSKRFSHLLIRKCLLRSPDQFLRCFILRFILQTQTLS